MSLKHALLGFLTYRPATGYELKDWFAGSVQHFWSADLSQIYRTLDGMREEDLVEMQVEQQEGKPPRHIYSLTEQGRQELIRWLREPLEELAPARSQFLIKIFFGALLHPEEVIAHLERHRHLLQKRLAVYREIERQIPEIFANPHVQAHAAYVLSTVRLGLKVIKANLDWCNETMAALRPASSVRPEDEKKSSKSAKPKGAKP